MAVTESRMGASSSAALARRLESFVPLFEQVCAWPGRLIRRKNELGAVQSLKCMKEGRPVDLFEHVTPNLYDMVGPDPEYHVVEGSMMDRAHGNSVGDDGLAALSVFTNVSRVQQLRMAETAQRALARVRLEHPQTKKGLMKPTLHNLIDIPPLKDLIGWMQELTSPLRTKILGWSDDELLLLWLLFD
jgi:hypothetical protein